MSKIDPCPQLTYSGGELWTVGLDATVGNTSMSFGIRSPGAEKGLPVGGSACQATSCGTNMEEIKIFVGSRGDELGRKHDRSARTLP